MASQDIADKVCLHLHLHHFQRSAQHTAEDVGVPQLVLRAPIIGQLHEVCQWVLVKYQRELFVICRPVGDLGRNVQENLEANLALISD